MQVSVSAKPLLFFYLAKGLQGKGQGGSIPLAQVDLQSRHLRFEPRKSFQSQGLFGKRHFLGPRQNVPVVDGTPGRTLPELLQGDRSHPLSPFRQTMDGNRFRLSLDKTSNHPRDGLAGPAVDQRESDTAEFFLKQAAPGGGHHAQAPNQNE